MLVDLGPQRPLARLRARHGARRALPRARALLARHPPRLGGRRRARATASTPSTCCAPASRPAPSRGAPKVRAMQIISELEGYRRGPYAGAVGYALPGRHARHLHRDPDDRPRTTASRGSRPARGSSPTRDPSAEHEECLRKLAALERAIDLAEAAAVILLDRQLRLVHLQPRAPVRRARRRGRRAAKRRDRRRRGRAARAVAPRRLPRARAGPTDAGATLEIVRRLAPRVPTLGVCLGHQAIVEAFGGEIGQAQTLVHGKASAITHDGRGLFRGPARATSSPAATTRSPRRAIPDELEVSAHVATTAR